MKCNVGGADKTIRYIVGAVALGVGLLAPLDTHWKIAASVVAAIAFVTATVGFCPLNNILGVNTCKGR